ncbi:MAG: oligosaccharide flippase family protein, partial [Bacteroidia bacterium]
FVLGRLYEPSQVGELEIVLKISAVLIAIAGLRYEMAIIVEGDQEKANNLTRLSLFLNFIFSCLTLLVLLVFKDSIASFFGFSSSDFLLFVPLMVWFSGSAEALLLHRNRDKLYSKISTNRVATSLSGVSYKVGHPFLSLLQANGLLVGHILGQAVAFGHMLYKLPFHVLRYSTEQIKQVAKSYKSFPLYSMPGAVLNIVATSLPVFLISYYAGESATGHFSYAYKLSYLPLSMLAMALGQVYFEKLSRSSNNKTETQELSKDLLLFLSGLGIIPCIILFFWGQELALFFLGDKWSDAGLYIENTILFYTAMFITNPFFCTFDVYKRLKSEFLFNLLFMVLTGATMVMAYQLFDSTIIALQWFSVIGIVLRLSILQYFFKLVGDFVLTKWLLFAGTVGAILYVITF